MQSRMPKAVGSLHDRIHQRTAPHDDWANSDSHGVFNMASETFDFNVTLTIKGGVPDLADDVYNFTVTEIKKAEGGDPKYDKGHPRAEFVYELDQVDEAGDAIVVRDWITVYPKPAPKSKLYRLISAVLYGGEE